MGNKAIKISEKTETFFKKFLADKKTRINKLKSTPIDLSKAQRVG